jgi:CTP:molybdopterin cytidylyltransferase MocA
MLRAVITAGGRVDEPFARATGSPVKALAPFGAGVLIDVGLRALRAAGIDDIAVVGDDEVARHLANDGVRVVPAAADGATNVLRALAAWPDGDLVFAASDLPFLDGPGLAAFLTASAGFDLTMPLAEGADYERAFPGAANHITALGATRVANGSVFFIAGSARDATARVAGRFFDARKSAFAMARLLGVELLVRYLVRRLQIADVERRAQRALGVRAAGIRHSAPGLCYDIDSLDDYRYACARS